MNLRRYTTAPAALALASLALGTSTATAATTEIAGPTGVRYFDGTAVLSLRDAASQTYRLATSVGGAAPQPIPGIAPAAQAFQADIGPGSSGSPVIIYTRCAAPKKPNGLHGPCHLFRTTLAGGAEKPIAGATSTEGSETAPTVWGSRLAFARTYAKGSARVYTRPLSAPASVRSTRLPGVPRKVCEPRLPCRPITDGVVAELELRGTALAQVIDYSLATEGICGVRQVRTVDVKTSKDVLVADTICGLGGQTWLGVSWVASRLLFAKTCPGDPAGCDGASSVAYRYTTATRKMEKAKQHVLVTGFAATDLSHAIEVQTPYRANGTCDNFDPSQPAPTCVFASSVPFKFVTTRP